VNGGEKVSAGFVVARGDGAKLLELGEEILDQVARLVEVTVIVAADLAVGLGWDHHGLPGARERIDDALLVVECLVADQRQVERDGIAERIVTDGRLIFLKGDIAGVVQRVLDMPVTSDCGSSEACGGGMIGHVVCYLGGAAP